MEADLVDASVEEAQLQKQQQRERALTTGVGRLCFLNLFSWLMMIPARPEMVLRGSVPCPLTPEHILCFCPCHDQCLTPSVHIPLALTLNITCAASNPLIVFLTLH